MALGKGKIATLAGLLVAGAVAVGVVWQSGAESEVGPVRVQHPPPPLLKEPDPALRAALAFPPPTGASGVLQCLPGVPGGGASFGQPGPDMAPGYAPPTSVHRPPADFVGRLLPGWHEPASTPEEAVENIMLSERHRFAGKVRATLTYVVRERSDAAGLANAWGFHPDGRRVALVPLQRHEHGEWAPHEVELAPIGKPDSAFATEEEWLAYNPYTDPDAVWSWHGGDILHCGGLLDPSPTSAP